MAFEGILEPSLLFTNPSAPLSSVGRRVTLADLANYLAANHDTPEGESTKAPSEGASASEILAFVLMFISIRIFTKGSMHHDFKGARAQVWAAWSSDTNCCWLSWIGQEEATSLDTMMKTDIALLERFPRSESSRMKMFQAIFAKYDTRLRAQELEVAGDGIHFTKMGVAQLLRHLDKQLPRAGRERICLFTDSSLVPHHLISKYRLRDGKKKGTHLCTDEEASRIASEYLGCAVFVRSGTGFLHHSVFPSMRETQVHRKFASCYYFTMGNDFRDELPVELVSAAIERTISVMREYMPSLIILSAMCDGDSRVFRAQAEAKVQGLYEKSRLATHTEFDDHYFKFTDLTDPRDVCELATELDLAAEIQEERQAASAELERFAYEDDLDEQLPVQEEEPRPRPASVDDTACSSPSSVLVGAPGPKTQGSSSASSMGVPLGKASEASSTVPKGLGPPPGLEEPPEAPEGTSAISAPEWLDSDDKCDAEGREDRRAAGDSEPVGSCETEGEESSPIAQAQAEPSSAPAQLTSTAEDDARQAVEEEQKEIDNKRKKHQMMRSAEERITPGNPRDDDDDGPAEGGPASSSWLSSLFGYSDQTKTTQGGGGSSKQEQGEEESSSLCRSLTLDRAHDDPTVTGGPQLCAPDSTFGVSTACKGGPPLAIDLFSHRGPTVTVGPSDVCAHPGDANYIWINVIYSQIMLAPKRNVPLRLVSWPIELQIGPGVDPIWKAGGVADLATRQHSPDVAALVTIGITPAVWADFGAGLQGGTDFDCMQYQDHLWDTAPEIRPEWTLNSGGDCAGPDRRFKQENHYWRMSPPIREDGQEVDLRGMPCEHWPTKEWVAACGIDPEARISRCTFIWLHASGLMAPSKAWEAWAAGRIQEYRRRMDRACGVDTRDQDAFYDSKWQTVAAQLQFCSYELQEVRDPRVTKIQVTPPAENSRVIQARTRDTTHMVTAGPEGPIMIEKEHAQGCRAITLEMADPLVYTLNVVGQPAY